MKNINCFNCSLYIQKSSSMPHLSAFRLQKFAFSKYSQFRKNAKSNAYNCWKKQTAFTALLEDYRETDLTLLML